jgi:hypothetical protein
MVTELFFYYYSASVEAFAYIFIRCVTSMFMYRALMKNSLGEKQTSFLIVYISDS